jgi:hypothetical protein
VTFFITTLLADAEAAVLAACALHTAAAQFTVLCAASQAAHHDELPAWYGSSCYSATCTAWQQQLNYARRAAGQGPCSLSLLYCPLLLCPLSSTAFVLPPSAAAAALPRIGAVPAGFSTRPATAAADDSDDDVPTHKEPSPGRRGGGGGGGNGSGSGKTSQAAAGPTTGVALLAHSLSGVAALLGFRAEAFAVGPFSRLVSRWLAHAMHHIQLLVWCLCTAWSFWVLFSDLGLIGCPSLLHLHHAGVPRDGLCTSHG